MPTRRTTMILAASGLAAAMPVWPGAAAAQAAPRANPMPEALRRDLERDPAAPVIGNPAGTITLTEFFDYNCPFCRKMAPVLQRLIAADPQLRVAMREWPVFGEDSEFAARAALAAQAQGRYRDFHMALMAIDGRAAEPSVMRTARDLGLDQDRLRRDMMAEAVTREIERAFALADHMQLIGTPTFIAGDEAVFGDNSVAQMQDLIARGRAALRG